MVEPKKLSAERMAEWRDSKLPFPHASELLGHIAWQEQEIAKLKEHFDNCSSDKIITIQLERDQLRSEIEKLRERKKHKKQQVEAVICAQSSIAAFKKQVETYAGNYLPGNASSLFGALDELREAFAEELKDGK